MKKLVMPTAESSDSFGISKFIEMRVRVLCVEFGIGGMASAAITRDDLDSAGLGAAASGTRNPRQARRLLALAMVLDGCLQQLAGHAGDAWNGLMNDAERITSITARTWAHIKIQAGWHWLVSEHRPTVD
jgi:hypothetical protein